MSIENAVERINSAIVLLKLIEGLFSPGPGAIKLCKLIQDTQKFLLDAKEELKDYKL